MVMNKKYFKTLIYSCSLLILMSTAELRAQAVAQDVLDDIIISTSDHTGIIKITFRVPARYISHTPKQLGDKILVKIALLQNNSSPSNYRESLVPRGKHNFGLEEVTFENEASDGFKPNQFMTLYFAKDVSFEIIQDPSYRSLSLIIHSAQ